MSRDDLERLRHELLTSEQRGIAGQVQHLVGLARVGAEEARTKRVEAGRLLYEVRKTIPVNGKAWGVFLKSAGLTQPTAWRYIKLAATAYDLPLIHVNEQTPTEVEPCVPLESLAGSDFGVIYADPPWQHDNTASVGADAGYDRMSTDAICAMPVETIAAKDAVLFLWACNPMLPEALRVMEAWGFTYKAMLTWDKGGQAGGNYFLGRTEQLLLGTRGRPGAAFKKPESLLAAKRGRHSEKPVEVYTLIEGMYPALTNRIELFARARRDGWAAWGNQVPTKERALEKILALSEPEQAYVIDAIAGATGAP